MAAELVAGLRVPKLLAGARGAQPPDLAAVTRAIVGLSDLAIELGDRLAVLDINPLICGPRGAVAVGALLIRAPPFRADRRSGDQNPRGGAGRVVLSRPR